MAQSNELPPPPGARIDPKRSNEVLRAWIVGEALQVSLQTAFEDPQVWGIMLVDIARHAARAYADQGGHTFEQAMARIRFMWDAESAKPTDLGTTSRPPS
ncbi:MAG TPA: DUF5076 domain-containing protein [Caulobacteraceae bacterium]|jgi:hypothetical protein